MSTSPKAMVDACRLLQDLLLNWSPPFVKLRPGKTKSPERLRGPGLQDECACATRSAFPDERRPRRYAGDHQRWLRRTLAAKDTARRSMKLSSAFVPLQNRARILRTQYPDVKPFSRDRRKDSRSVVRREPKSGAPRTPRCAREVNLPVLGTR